MKIAFHIHAARGHFRAQMPTAAEQASLLAWVAGHGFDGVDISDSWGFAGIDEAAALATRALAGANGLAIPTVSCMGKTLCHPALGEGNQAAIAHALDVATWMGASVVNIALAAPRVPGVVPTMGARASPGGSVAATEADFSITAQRLRELARNAAAKGLLLSLELHDRSLADTSASMLRLIHEAGEPNIGTNPDLCNGYRAYEQPPETWQEALRALAPRANLWHVNNMQRVHFAEVGRAAFVERPLGEGDVDYRMALRTMRAAGFKGWIVTEYKGTGDALETLARSRDYLARLLTDGDIT